MLCNFQHSTVAIAYVHGHVCYSTHVLTGVGVALHEVRFFAKFTNNLPHKAALESNEQTSNSCWVPFNERAQLVECQVLSYYRNGSSSRNYCMAEKLPSMLEHCKLSYVCLCFFFCHFAVALTKICHWTPVSGVINVGNYYYCCCCRKCLLIIQVMLIYKAALLWRLMCFYSQSSYQMQCRRGNFAFGDLVFLWK